MSVHPARDTISKDARDRGELRGVAPQFHFGHVIGVVGLESLSSDLCRVVGQPSLAAGEIVRAVKIVCDVVKAAAFLDEFVVGHFVLSLFAVPLILRTFHSVKRNRKLISHLRLAHAR